MITLAYFVAYLILSIITFVILTYWDYKGADFERELDRPLCTLLGLTWPMTLIVFLIILILIKPVNWLDAKIRKWVIK